MALDGLIDPVASSAGMAAVLASGLADTDRVFRRSWRCARRPVPTGAPWPATGRSHPGSRGCWRGCAMPRCQPPRLFRPAS